MTSRRTNPWRARTTRMATDVPARASERQFAGSSEIDFRPRITQGKSRLLGGPFQNVSETGLHAFPTLDARHNPFGGAWLGQCPAGSGEFRSEIIFRRGGAATDTLQTSATVEGRPWALNWLTDIRSTLNPQLEGPWVTCAGV